MDTKLLLDTHTEHSGLVVVKGKGRLDTYWLSGKEGWLATWYENEMVYSMEEGPSYMKDILEKKLFILIYVIPKNRTPSSCAGLFECILIL